jgi:hypothetical protein
VFKDSPQSHKGKKEKEHKEEKILRGKERSKNWRIIIEGKIFSVLINSHQRLSAFICG